MFKAAHRAPTNMSPLQRLFSFAGCLLGGLLVLLAGILPASAHAVAQYTFESTFIGVLREGELMHVLTDKACYALTSEGRLESCPYNCQRKPAETLGNAFSYLMTTPEKHTYGLTIRGEFFLWTPGAEKTWEYITTFDDIGRQFGGMEPEYYELDVAYYADETTIYEQVYHRETDTVEINCYDIATGEKKHLYTTRSYEVGPGAIHPDGGLVMEGNSNGKNLLLRYTKTGERETVVEMPFLGQQIFGLVSDDADGWYIITDNSLYHLSASGEMTLVNVFTRMSFDWYTPTYNLPVNQTVGFRDSNWHMLHASPLYMEDREVLVINGQTGGVVDFALNLIDYENRHTNTSVVLQNNLADFEDMAQAISLVDTKNDIYSVCTNNDGIQSLKEKGMFYDLSGNAKIAAYVESLYPAWREIATTEDGKIVGVPLMVWYNHQLTYCESTWEENGLGEVPKTYDELLDSIEAWHEDGRLENIRLFQSGATYQQLVLQMLKSNAARYAMRGEAVVYSNETLLRLLERLEGMRDMLENYDRMNVLGEPLFKTDMWFQMRFYESYADYVNLSLGMENEDDYGCLMDLYVLVVNPRSEQIELAVQFLQEILGDFTLENERKLVVPGDELGLIDEEAMAYIESASAELQAYQEEFWRIKKDEHVIAEWLYPNMDLLKSGLAYYADERSHYIIVPEYDALFREAMEHVAVNEASGYLLMWNNASTAINGFIDGKNSAENMLKKMDDIMWMWTMENQ